MTECKGRDYKTYLGLEDVAITLMKGKRKNHAFYKYTHTHFITQRYTEPSASILTSMTTEGQDLQ